MARLSPALGSPCGAQPSTGAGPRITSGAVTPTPSPPRAGAARRGKGGDGAVQPAAIGAVRPRITALQHILPVEMRTVAVAGRNGVHRERALLLIEPRECRHGRIQREEAIERKARAVAGRGKRQCAMQQRIIGIADRRYRRQSIKRAAQNDDDDARVSRCQRR